LAIDDQARRLRVKQKAIKITCQGAATAKLEELIPLQGDLKKLDAERYRKLKRSLLKHGFSFPFFAWKNAGKLYILDGHQRDRALRRLKAQGYHVPPLPIAFIEAKDEREAREKILVLSSQYGEMTDDTLLEYLKQSDIDLDDVLDTVDLPTVNVEKLAARLEEELEGQQPDEELDHQFQVIVECKDEDEQLKLIEKLEKQRYTCRALIL
jgi:ParB-like chromosome segregation protein Spo0J